MILHYSNIRTVILLSILSCNLFAKLSVSGGISYGGVSYSHDIQDYATISNETGYIGTIEKSFDQATIGLGVLQQKYTEDFSYSQSEPIDYSFKYKSKYQSNYVVVYAIYPYEFKKFNIWGGLQIGKLIDGQVTTEVDGQEFEFEIEPSDFKLDYGLSIGLDYMLMKSIGARLSYYYGLSRILKNDVDLIIQNELNKLNVSVNAQILFSF